VEEAVDQTHQVETIQVVLEPELLKAADRAAKQAGCNRSALVRQALRQYLATQRTVAREAADRAGYQRSPQGAEDSAWDGVAAWPPD
jgi:predicted transcriptional regulator